MTAEEERVAPEETPEEEEEGDGFELEVCCTCGIPFQITTSLYNLRKRDHRGYHCPNGHTQHYAKPQAEVDREKQVAELAAQVKQLTEDLAAQTERHGVELEAMRAELAETYAYTALVENALVTRWGWLQVLCYWRRRQRAGRVKR